MKCLKCGTENSEAFLFCVNCGAKLKDKKISNDNLCKNCGHELVKKEKFCSNCGKRKGNKKISIIILIISIFILSLFINGIIVKTSRGDTYEIKRYLERKYNQDFQDIVKIKSIKNPDTDLGCDGASFGTIKGKGETVYYKVYSKKDDIEFFAYKDTNTNDYGDAYGNYLTRRKTLLKVYDLVKSKFDKKINKILLDNDEYDLHMEIESYEQLKEKTSVISENQLKKINGDYDQLASDLIMIYIDEDLFEFSKNNYDAITNFYAQILKLRNDFYFGSSILLKNGAFIELNLDGYVYVYDEFKNDKVWGEKLDDFVKRDSY